MSAAGSRETRTEIPKVKRARVKAKRPDHEKLIITYEKDAKLQGLCQATLYSRGYTLRSFGKFMDDRDTHILDADREDIRAWIEAKRFSNECTTLTIKNTLTHISGLFDYLEYEGLVSSNPVPAVRKRYMRSYKDSNECHSHRLVSVEEMAQLIKSALDIRDRCIMVLMAKTGIRRGELVSLDASDINLDDQSILLKSTGKRSNRLVFFDDEAAVILRRWLAVRQARNKKNDPALFISQKNVRLGKKGIDDVVKDHASRLGLHDTESDDLEDHFGSHCFRHWFVTNLLRAGCPRDYVQWLRGDAPREAIDIYNHIDPPDVKKAYLACIPQLGL